MFTLAWKMCISYCAEREHTHAGTQYSEEVRKLTASPLPGVRGVLVLFGSGQSYVTSLKQCRFSCNNTFLVLVAAGCLGVRAALLRCLVNTLPALLLG